MYNSGKRQCPGGLEECWLNVLYFDGWCSKCAISCWYILLQESWGVCGVAQSKRQIAKAQLDIHKVKMSKFIFSLKHLGSARRVWTIHCRLVCKGMIMSQNLACEIMLYPKFCIYTETPKTHGSQDTSLAFFEVRLRPIAAGPTQIRPTPANRKTPRWRYIAKHMFADNVQNRAFYRTARHSKGWLKSQAFYGMAENSDILYNGQAFLSMYRRSDIL